MYAVLFDIDGTLLLTAGAGMKAFAAAFAELFEVRQLSGDIPFAGRSDRAIALDLMRVHGIEPTAEHWRQFVESYPQHLETTLPQCAGEVMPGVPDLLDALQRRNHVLVGLLTGNLRSGAARKLSHYGLADRFKFGGFGDLWTDRNAIASEARAQARYHARGKLDGVMVIGDTVHDIRCARSIGACAVAVPTGNTSADQLREEAPDLVVGDLTEVEPLLERINENGATPLDTDR
jgi:phosphoglycolate phosphatase-like HAD superfamily hydrolase